MSADYSQIELRLAAVMANVPQLKEAFSQGEDIHAMTAQELFGSVDRDTRGRAKNRQFRDPLRHFIMGARRASRVDRREGKAISNAISNASPESVLTLRRPRRSFANTGSREPCLVARRTSQY